MLSISCALKNIKHIYTILYVVFLATYNTVQYQHTIVHIDYKPGILRRVPTVKLWFLEYQILYRNDLISFVFFLCSITLPHFSFIHIAVITVPAINPANIPHNTAIPISLMVSPPHSVKLPYANIIYSDMDLYAFPLYLQRHTSYNRLDIHNSFYTHSHQF